MRIQKTKVLLISLLAILCCSIFAPLALAEDTNNIQKNQQKTGYASESFSVGTYLNLDKKYLEKDAEGKERDGQEQKYLKSKAPIASFILQIINFLTLSIGSLAFLCMVIGGFILLISHGNENLVTKGKEIITYALIGLVVAFSAYFITAFVQSLFYEIA